MLKRVGNNYEQRIVSEIASWNFLTVYRGNRLLNLEAESLIRAEGAMRYDACFYGLNVDGCRIWHHAAALVVVVC